MEFTKQIFQQLHELLGWHKTAKL